MARTRHSSKQKKQQNDPDNNENCRNRAPEDGTNNKEDRRKRTPDDAPPAALTLRQQSMLQEAVAAKDRELAALKRQIEDQQPQKPPAKRRKSVNNFVQVLTLNECPDGEKISIIASVAHHVWTRFVFMPPPGLLQKTMMEITYDNMDPKIPEDEISKEDWVISRSNVVGNILNNMRGYVTGALKKVVRKCALECDGEWPDLEKITACALRTIPLVAPDNATEAELAEVAQNMDVFVFYWDQILPHALPQKTEFWGSTVRYQRTITHPDPKRYVESPITTQVEGFTILCLENCWDYWKNWQELQDKFPSKKLMKCPKDDVPDEGTPQYDKGYFVDKNSNTVYFFGPKFETKYTKSNAGSKITAGWSQKGLNRFGELCQQIRTARMSPKNHEIEEMVLRRVRDLMGNRKAQSGVKAIQQDHPEDEDPAEQSHWVAMDPDYAAFIGVQLPGKKAEEEMEDDRKPPAREVEFAEDDDESAGGYGEHDDYADVLQQESV